MEYKNNLLKEAYREETEEGLITISAEFATDEDAAANGFTPAFDSERTGHRYFSIKDADGDLVFARIIRTSRKYNPEYEYSEDGATCYSVDMTRCFGVLCSTNELSICVKLAEDGTAKIVNGWEFNCGGDWSWHPGEEKILEETHPGLLLELAQVLEVDGKAA